MNQLTVLAVVAAVSGLFAGVGAVYAADAGVDQQASLVVAASEEGGGASDEGKTDDGKGDTKSGEEEKGKDE